MILVGGPGTRLRPFRTLQRGADALSAGDPCIVHAGTYRETVVLKASGRQGKSVRIEAEPGETVVLSGTEPIAGPWERSKGQIHRTTETRAVGQLFVDGEPMTEARWPNMPFARRLDWTGAVATLNIGSWQTFRRVVRTHGAGGDRFTYETDPQSRLARSKPHRVGFDRYFLAGKLEALDSPGEWFLDRRAGMLYLWAPDGTDPAGCTFSPRRSSSKTAATSASRTCTCCTRRPCGTRSARRSAEAPPARSRNPGPAGDGLARRVS